ncbi:hypothetical protein BK412_25445 [Vibrio campbellii]|uniref:DUF4365 domain-containing protein n=1 Tax=Vibrio campbellii TaxID=680 RepID=UPI0009BE8EFE|nr:DUF4365 domain-containing protein [Vibrio campbellii]OQP99907.1 hypothetical protein BK412_25445 [Vibrio campbellii]
MGTTKLTSSAIAKKGVNFVRDIVESSNSIFHEVHQENDYGNDAFIELVDGTDVKGITVAVQIKSGKSFCSNVSCSIPASRQHFDYWLSHSLNVVGVVFDPEEQKSYWIDIKNYLRNNPDVVDHGPYTITFKKTAFAEFSSENFEKIFKPIHLRNQIVLDLNEAIKFVLSNDPTEHSVGINVLLRSYCHKLTAWQQIIAVFKERQLTMLDPAILYSMAHIPGHPDIYWTSTQKFPQELREQLKLLISRFGVEDIVRILCMLDVEDGFERGSLGQSAEAIISIVDKKAIKLVEIIKNCDLQKEIRDLAVMLYAYYEQELAIQPLKDFAVKYPELLWASELAEQLEVEGYVYFY